MSSDMIPDPSFCKNYSSTRCCDPSLHVMQMQVLGTACAVTISSRETSNGGKLLDWSEIDQISYSVLSRGAGGP